MARVECNESELFQFADLFCDSEVDTKKIEKAVEDILDAIGEDKSREGLEKTPDRVARAYREMLEGYRTDPIKLVNKALFSVEYDDMVIVRDIEFFSMCEHHMLPFLGRAHVAYLPNKRVIGLSKIPRIVDMFSRRLQVQERMTRQIADFINVLLKPRGVAVVVEAVHMCAMVRGVRKHDARMTTSSMLGAFRNREATRMEFLDNISRGARPLEF
ncbi:MAG: GTP cyclohydrolase I FolE [Chloroflexi bacterium]|nr:GTP cyclohydrolase I FolE [Chloroflexota bacterium]